MSTIKRFEDLDVWKESRTLNKIIGCLIQEKKFEHNFRLINQIEGSSGSIMDNIAEGFERGTRGEFIQFLGYSKGSCGELRSQLYRALDRNYIIQEQFDELLKLVSRISAMLHGLILYLQKTKINGLRKNIPEPNKQNTLKKHNQIHKST
jgi:four helix bundle protein